MYDYANHFEAWLGGTSHIGAYADGARGKVYPDAMSSRPRFEARFPGRVHVLQDGAGALDVKLADVGADALYTIQAGCNSMPISPAFKPMLVHAVFGASPKLPRCAAVSPTADVAAGVPVVHHMVYLDPSLADTPPMKLSALEGAERVFCRHGGGGTFSIDFARRQIQEHVTKFPKDIFLLMNTDRFPGDENYPNNIIFLGITTDLREKRSFLNTCDACIHARVDGETFGLAVAECSLAGLPVITSTLYGGFHLGVLGAHALTYDSQERLRDILAGFDAKAHQAKADVYRRLYDRFSPEIIMREFVDGFGLMAEIQAVENPKSLAWQGLCVPPPNMVRWLPAQANASLATS